MIVDSIWTGAVGLGFLLWWIASVIHQCSPRWWHALSRYDWLCLVPSWTFFAPRPGRRDDHLVYRDVERGQAGAWTEVDVGDARPRLRWIWNPCRFRQKALMDLVNGLHKTRRGYREHQIDDGIDQFSLPYLGLLAWVSTQPAASWSRLRQFAVVATMGHGPERRVKVVFVSKLHRLPDHDVA
jgi:hypothetical protein